MEWQPIETAPRDGSEILAFDGERMLFVKWRVSFETRQEFVRQDGDLVVYRETTVDEGYWDSMRKPTHWLPLPPPPVNT